MCYRGNKIFITISFNRPSIDGSSFTCSEKDDVPVDTEEIFEGHCESIQGNKYEEHSETSSCCECLM